MCVYSINMDLEEVIVLIGIGVATAWLEQNGYLQPLTDEVYMYVPKLVHTIYEPENELQTRAKPTELKQHQQATFYSSADYKVGVKRDKNNPISTTGQQSDLTTLVLAPANTTTQSENHVGEYGAAPQLTKKHKPAGGLFNPPPQQK